MDTLKKIQDLAKRQQADTVAIRRHLHTYPELSYEEAETAKFIAARLEDYSISYRPNIGGHGIVAEIQGQNPHKRTLALRGDMDALPIQETNDDLSYKSQNPGVMHACGHDVHTSSLLGTARILQEIRQSFEGTVRLIFQPAEEKLPGGASIMIKDGVLTNPEPFGIIGQHVHPPLATGKIGLKAGVYMASADEIYVTVKGRGGHGAMPQDCIDPILVTSHLIVALQQIVSRNGNPTTPSVLTFGKIIGNGATNIIPDEVRLEGTFRTMNEPWRADAHERMVKMANALCESMGATCEFNIIKGYPVLINHDELTRQVRGYAVDYLGADNVVDLPIRMTAEDFAYYSQVVPACFYRLGTGNPAKNTHHPLHTSRFNVDEDALEVSTGLMAWCAVQTLNG